jgi:hypothetical protein
MSNQFLKLRRSAVQGKIPETSSLDLGELAINTFDGQLFLKKSGSQGELVTIVGSTGSFTGSFTGNGAGLNNIPASGITGLNLSRIATGSITASVSNTDISASFRLTSGSNTLLNVTKDGYVWIGNGAFTNQGYQLDVNGTTRLSGKLTANTIDMIGSIIYLNQTSIPNSYLYATSNITILNGTEHRIGGGRVGINTTNGGANANVSSILDLQSTTLGFLPPRTNTTASITSPAQGLLTYITASGEVEGLWQYRTGSNGWVQFLHNSSSIPASSVVGLNLSRISTGSITASVSNTDITASFRLTSGSNTLLNVTKDGYVWIGNGAVSNQAYQLEVNGTARITGQLTVNSNILLPYVAGSTITIKSQFNNRDVSISSAGKITMGESGASLTTGTYSFYYLPTVGSIRGFAVMSQGSENYELAPLHILNNRIEFGQTYQAFSNNQQKVLAEFTSLNNWKLYGALAGNYQAGLVMTIAGSFSGTFTDANNQGVAGRLILKGGDAQTTATNINTAGGNIEISGGLGTGTGIPGDVIFATAALTASGNTLQSLTNRVWIKGNTGTLTNRGTSSLAVLDISGSSIFTGSIDLQGSLTASNALITGTLTAQTLIVQTITSSIIYSSGSNIFGNRLTDTQQFTGSVLITGSTVSLTGGSFSGSGANLYNIPASGITGLNLSRIATGSISASVNTDITASFRLVNGSNTLLNVTRDGYVWIGNGAVSNQSYQLDVNGTTRVNGDLTLKDRVIFDTLTKGIQLVSGFPHEPSILIGSQNSGYPTVGNRHIIIGVANSVNNNASLVANIGFANNLSAHSFISNVYGVFNTLGVNAGTLYPLLIGGSNNFSPITSLGGTPSGLLIGTGNTSTFATSAAIGWNNTVTAENQLIFGYSQSNVSIGGWTDVYFGTGVRSKNQNLLGKNVTINSSGAGEGTDLTGGSLILAGGKSTGAATSPDVIFATTTILTTGTTLQSLTNRWWVKGTSGTLSNISNPPSASLYVSGSFILNGTQFNNTSSVTVAGITTVSQLSTSSYTSCFYNYTVASSSNARSGQVMTVWNGDTIRYTEVVTTDIGDTNLVAVSASLSSGFVRLQVSASSGWTFKNISNLL